MQSTPSVWIISQARSFGHQAASAHLTEPIWLGLLIVALPDLATPIAKSAGNVFGTIEIRTIAGLKSPRWGKKGGGISAGCHLLEGSGEGGDTSNYTIGTRSSIAGRISKLSGVKCRVSSS